MYLYRKVSALYCRLALFVAFINPTRTQTNSTQPDVLHTAVVLINHTGTQTHA